ncbi:unnamed protein product [Blepharisma stoltei]|uniref:Growth arrest-specific protein 8 domain-containing protein n=1 Tax=Blepharisma stoltei TaxID=1481888 RepID=A0AAU9KQG2_9CILI|nr:unnamed protein product [Blepharisma stoltei]
MKPRARRSSSKNQHLKVDIPYEVKFMDIPTLQVEIQEWKQKLKKAKEINNANHAEKMKIKDELKEMKENILALDNSSRKIKEEFEQVQERNKIELQTYYNQITFLEKRKTLDEINKNNEYFLLDCNKEEKLKNGIEDIMRETRNTTEIVQESNDINIDLLEKNSTTSIANLRIELEKIIADLKKSYKTKYSKLKENLEGKLKVAIYETEQKYNEIKRHHGIKHKNASEAMRNYFDKIKLENAKTIENQKQEILEIKKNIDGNAAEIEKVQKSNNELEKPLKEIKHELFLLETRLADWAKTKEDLREANAKIDLLQKDLKTKKEKWNALREKYNEILAERNELYKCYELSISKLNTIMGNKETISLNSDEYENQVLRKEEQLSNVLEGVVLNKTSTETINKEIKKQMKHKDELLKNLKESLAQSVDAYFKTENLFKTKLKEKSNQPEDF